MIYLFVFFMVSSDGIGYPTGAIRLESMKQCREIESALFPPNPMDMRVPGRTFGQCVSVGGGYRPLDQSSCGPVGPDCYAECGDKKVKFRRGLDLGVGEIPPHCNGKN